MKRFGLALCALMLATPALAQEVTVTPVLRTISTATGQPIVFPQENAELVVATYEIQPGAVLPEHEHPHPRFAYVLQGNLRVDNTEMGKSDTYKAGDFIVEAISEWHKGTNIGTDPVKLLVIDVIPKDGKNVVVK